MSSTVAALKVAMDTLTAQMHGKNYTTPRIFTLDAIPSGTAVYEGDLWINTKTQAFSYYAGGQWNVIYDPAAIAAEIAASNNNGTGGNGV